MWISSILGRPLGAATSTSRARPRRFRPVLEALEDRCTPACSVVQAGGTLSITTLSAGLRHGNNHTIQVNDDGRGNVQVICDGAAPMSFSGVSHIAAKGSDPVFGLGGSDTVRYNLTGTLLGTQGLVVNLKGGNDVFSATVANGVGSSSAVPSLPGNLGILVLGGDGNDQINFRMAGAVGLSSSVLFDVFAGDGNDLMGASVTGDVMSGGTLDVRLRGQAGDDVGFIGYSGQVLRGTLRTQEDGGSGDDRFSTTFNLATEISGVVSASEVGGSDNDRLRLRISKVPIGVNGRIDGGPGFDRCFRTANVLTHLNCELDVVIP